MALQVIGSGFGRTGTMSMKHALEQLLGGKCYHMVECFPKGPEHYRLWVEAARGKPDWDAIFDGYEATVDFPACTSYQALADYYPDAKVILTVRDPERWFESTQDTIFSPEWIEYLPGSEAGPYMSATVDDYFDNRMHDRDHLISRFNEHIAAVKNAISPERLLVFEAKDGWEPLCEFLDLPAPQGDYPHINDTEATREIIRTLMEQGFAKTFGFAG